MVHWVSAHGAEACFVFALQVGDGWVELAREHKSALDVGEHLQFNVDITILEGFGAGEYKLRVSVAESSHRCPHLGETDFPILAADATITAESSVDQELIEEFVPNLHFDAREPCSRPTRDRTSRAPLT